ncbi:hypothetical protein ACIQAC_00820 [Streptomyces sp. NPDC088387]|uniref:hypothetical protein n=1 Tax=Streptomyces sp. NPDC088387 TaxID=3365859 RepID=UPI0037FE778C
MGTGPGAAAGRPLRSVGVGLVLAACALLTGCADPQPRAAPSAADTVTPAPHTTPPAEVCARIIGHWSRKVLDDNTYGDYQSMGLSNGQYEILMNVVDAARAEQRRAGRASAEQLIDRQADERCTERYRDGNPSAGPWS